NDNYTVTPHLTYTSSVAGVSVRNNDAPANISPITGFGFDLASANGTIPNGTNFITAGGAGGAVILNPDGTFIFYPDAGDDAPLVSTFFYTVAGGDTAQVTLTFDAQELVWFVDDNAVAPFCTVAN
ncbi:MAG TPA: hypothetical protein PLZ51_27830, partial [Aggregatilineales bacterium]|nr:hypothetical protein [Aggregatilineales bacterium]